MRQLSPLTPASRRIVDHWKYNSVLQASARQEQTINQTMKSKTQNQRLQISARTQFRVVRKGNTFIRSRWSLLHIAWEPFAGNGILNLATGNPLVVSVNNSERQTNCQIRYKLKLKPVCVVHYCYRISRATCEAVITQEPLGIADVTFHHSYKKKSAPQNP